MLSLGYFIYSTAFYHYHLVTFLSFFFFYMGNTMQKLLPASHWSRQQCASAGAGGPLSYVLIFVYIGT